MLWTPRSIPGLVAWYDAARGVTLRSPVTTADFTGWTAEYNCSLAGTTITDTNDGGATEHFASLSVSAVVQLGEVGTVTVELKAGTKSWVRVQLGRAAADVNLATGAVGTTTGTVVSAATTDIGNGWYRLVLAGTVTVEQKLYFVIGEGDNVITYTGDGTGTALMRNLSVSSSHITAWANQIVGDANTDLAQATAANQPLWNAGSANFAGHSSITFSKTRYDFFRTVGDTGLDSPTTWVWVGRIAAIDTAGIIMSALGGLGQYLAYAGGNWASWAGSYVQVAGGSIPQSFVLGVVFGAAGRLHVSAKAPSATGDSGPNNSDVVYVGWDGVDTGYAFDGELVGGFAFDRELSLIEMGRLFDWVRSKTALPIGD